MKAPVSALVLIILATLLVAHAPQPVTAQPESPAPRAGVQAAAEGVVLRLEWPGVAPASATPPASTLVALLLPPEGDAAPRLTRLQLSAWSGDAPDRAPLPARTHPDGEVYPPLPEFEAPPAPDAPISLLREGWLRDQRLGVYALNPVYVAGGAAFQVEVAEALVPGARPADVSALAQLEARPFATGAAPPDPLASGPAWKITVSASGIQELTAADLAAAGLNLAQADPTTLRLRYQGRDVPLEILRDGGGLPAALRFYAEAGDRWNATSIYWLTVGRGAGTPMAVREAVATDAPLRATAIEQGIWRSNRILESRLPGPDGDHFFSADLRVIPPPNPPDSVAATITPALPPNGPLTLTLQGATLRRGNFTLCARAGAPPADPSYRPCDTTGQPERRVPWTGQGTWSERVSLPAFATQVTVWSLPVTGADQVHLDAVAWEVPVDLNLRGNGARFVGSAGRFRYQLEGLPSGATVYDVSDPRAPVRLNFAGAIFEDTAPAPRTYLVTGPGTLHRPAVAAHTPVTLPRNAQAVYIAPRAFLEALEPLIAQRRAQGWTVAAVAVEALYDAWSGGQVHPEAIRSFLRYAAASWETAPVAVVLVGDGASDPRNYLGRNNRTWIPPYLAMVDPWLGETACETCFVRLQGDNPLQDRTPDMWLGRLPSRSVEETAALVAKILSYERSGRSGGWRGRLAYIADNPDIGGDFALAAEESIALHPRQARIARVYYDPAAQAGDPWRERDPLAALNRAMGAFDQGAAFVNFLGHGLQFQWAYTGPPLQPNAPQDRQYLLGLFEVDDLRNGGQLPVVLALSCLTGAFQTPAFTGTSIDERMVVRPDGGAIASWSSTGLGVLYGHDALQRGFYRALWAGQQPPPLGALTLAGHLELFTASSCCQETGSAFALLGDPLTAPQVNLGAASLYLPLTRR
ncbi:MAG: C25 family cysteine peptidase [Chloroflexaceae bacterium]|nr:C25 family cysteine peptidase [Chloroflexaceae bacterium]